jgi:hypothetical protein
MEHSKKYLNIRLNDPSESDMEKASNGYLMSLIAVMTGLPFPVFNLAASLLFFFANRKASYYVRWHCTQALLSQLILFFVNSVCFWWTISILFYDEKVSNNYFGYLFMVILFNLLEITSTIYAAIKTRKGKHVSFWVFNDLSNLILKNK